jgi:ParB family chromosome partitioning protein
MPSTTGKRKRRLGKGLGHLLARPVEVPTGDGPVPVAAAPSSPPAAGEGLQHLAIARIVPNPKQPRQVFDDDSLTSLAKSITTAGLMQPVVVRRQGEQFELVAGERRWRAATIAGLGVIPAIVRDVDDRTAAEWALIENLQREDLNPIDRAEALLRLAADFDLTHQDIADQIGIERSSVTNLLRLNDLDDPVKDAVRDGRLSMGHAKVLLGVPDASTCRAMARRCAKEQWSVRELERRLKKSGKSAKGDAQQGGDLNPAAANLADLSRQLGEHLGTKVQVVASGKKGGGRLVIDFFDNAQFEGILKRLAFVPKA